jgi:arylsulfate sulfotransferase
MRDSRRRLSTIALLFGIFGMASALAGQCTPPTSTVAGKSSGEPLTVSNFVNTKTWTGPMYAFNLSAAVTWQDCVNMMMTRPATAATMLILGPAGNDYQVQEINASGSVVWFVTMSVINAQLGPLKLLDFNHDAIRLPNGWTAIIGHVEQFENCATYPAQCNGATTGQVDLLGSAVVVVDTTGTVQWFWNPYLSFDPGRRAILGEKCNSTEGYNGGCPITLATVANDWMHGNSLYFDGNDSNLVFNLRNQDWALKLNFQNGAGNGNIVWRLGNQGDFTMLNTLNIPWPWFSHSHDLTRPDTQSTLYTLLDNGNTRVASNPGEKSRGQVLTVNEATMEADIYFNVNLPYYSSALGTAQLLDNGHYWFLMGIPIDSKGAAFSEGVEVTPAGVKVFAQRSDGPRYRAPRMATLFNGSEPR